MFKRLLLQVDLVILAYSVCCYAKYRKGASNISQTAVLVVTDGCSSNAGASFHLKIKVLRYLSCLSVLVAEKNKRQLFLFSLSISFSSI